MNCHIPEARADRHGLRVEGAFDEGQQRELGRHAALVELLDDVEEIAAAALRHALHVVGPAAVPALPVAHGVGVEVGHREACAHASPQVDARRAVVEVQMDVRAQRIDRPRARRPPLGGGDRGCWCRRRRGGGAAGCPGGASWRRRRLTGDGGGGGRGAGGGRASGEEERRQGQEAKAGVDAGARAGGTETWSSGWGSPGWWCRRTACAGALAAAPLGRARGESLTGVH